MSDAWLQTFSGKAAFPFDLQKDQVCIEDIAHHLSMICRFNGATRFHYSVAQHSLYVAAKLPKQMKLHGLLHDAAEYLLGDVTRPVKGCLEVRDDSTVEMDKYRSFSKVEHRALARIYDALGIEWMNSIEVCDKIKEVDNRMVMTEGRELLGKPPMSWNVAAKPYRGMVIAEISPKAAERLFLERYAEFTK
jgi:hypothetical protein